MNLLSKLSFPSSSLEPDRRLSVAYLAIAWTAFGYAMYLVFRKKSEGGEEAQVPVDVKLVARAVSRDTVMQGGSIKSIRMEGFTKVKEEDITEK